MPSRWSTSCCTTRAWKPSTVRSIGAPSESKPLVAQAREARHEAPHAGHRQAPLPALLLLAAERREHGIDEHGVGHGAMCG